MLYKKIHRQYLREFRKGRRFKLDGEIYKIIKKPFIDYPFPRICVKCESMWCRSSKKSLIIMIDSNDYIPSLGERIYKDRITWLKD